jgi:hypothetical protein
MAVRDYTGEWLAKGAHKSIWTGLLNGDSGLPITAATLSNKTVQVVGTFGTGGTVVIEGSNDGTNYDTLTDPQGNALTFLAAGLKSILENPQYIRPNVTVGDGTTDLSVFIVEDYV